MIPASAIADARAAQAQTGASDTAAALALSVAGPESGYNPSAIGDNGTSFGFTQLHQGGGLGDGYTQDQLLDPVKNLAIAMGDIQASLNNGATPYEAIGPWSTRDTAIGNFDEALAALGAAPAATAGAGVGGGAGLLSGGVLALAAGAAAVIWLVGG